MDPATALMIAGTATQILGGLSGSRAKARAARARAQALAAQKAEFLRRSDREIRNTFLESEASQSQMTAGFAQSNIDIGSKQTLLSRVEQDRQVTDNVLERRREVEFQAKQIEAGIAAAHTEAKSAIRTGYLNAISAGLSGTSDVMYRRQQLKALESTAESTAKGARHTQDLVGSVDSVNNTLAMLNSRPATQPNININVPGPTRSPAGKPDTSHLKPWMIRHINKYGGHFVPEGKFKGKTIYRWWGD